MKLRKKPIKLASPEYDNADSKAIQSVLQSGWWGQGPKVEELEEKFADLVGVNYACAVSSASHGQDLVVKATSKKSSKVLSPVISFITTAAVGRWNGLEIELIDVDEESLCLNPQSLKKNRYSSNDILIVLNHSGIRADYENIRKRFKGFIIEDAAHSCYFPGAGLGGDCAVWSFQAIKTLPCGDGGMITSNNKDLIERCKSMRWFGIESTWSRTSKKNSYSWDYTVSSLGYKCYMNDITAALCLSQLTRLDERLEKRRWIQKYYNNNLTPTVRRPLHSHTVQNYCMRVPPGVRDDLVLYLKSKSIHTSVHYKPLNMHPVFKSEMGNFPTANSEWKKLISLPVHSNMSAKDCEYVVYYINKFLKENCC